MKHLKIFENFNNDNEVEAIWGVDPYELFDLCLSTMDTVSLYAKLRLDFGLITYKTQTRWNAPSWEQANWNSIYALSDDLTKYDNIDLDNLLNSKNIKAFEIILSDLGNTHEEDKKVEDFENLISDRLKSYGMDFKIVDSDYSSTDIKYITIYLNNI